MYIDFIASIFVRVWKYAEREICYDETGLRLNILSRLVKKKILFL